MALNSPKFSIFVDMTFGLVNKQTKDHSKTVHFINANHYDRNCLSIDYLLLPVDNVVHIYLFVEQQCFSRVKYILNKEKCAFV